MGRVSFQAFSSVFFNNSLNDEKKVEGVRKVFENWFVSEMGNIDSQIQTLNGKLNQFDNDPFNLKNDKAINGILKQIQTLSRRRNEIFDEFEQTLMTK